MFRSLLCLNLLLLLFCSGFAQTGEKSYKMLPNKYNKPHLEAKVELPGDNLTAIWEVFSDRNKNQTYTTPGGTKVMKTLKYLDWFFVGEVDGEYIHIYKDNNLAEQEMKPSLASKDYGWIHQDNLLLWRSCLYNEQDVSKKAVLMNTIKFATKAKLEPGESKFVRFYDDPDMKEKNEYVCNVYQVFYIYKINYFPNSTKPRSYLLGTTARFMNYVEKDAVKGWVDAKRVTVWDHRVASIPNTASEAISERNSRKSKAIVFSTIEAARKYRDNQQPPPESVVWDYDSCKSISQYGSYFSRFPILSNQDEINKTNQIFKIGSIGEVNTISGRKLTEFQWADTKELLNKGSDINRNINMIFVIDGTKSMSPYFASVSEGIIESMKDLVSDKRNDFRFSVMIYRDKEDKDNVAEFKGLSSDYGVIASWLRDRKAFSNDDDHDFTEAVNYGVSSALRKTSPDKKQTNVVILVGDAGDNGKAIDDNPVTNTDVINLLHDYNCSFIAFQVHCPKAGWEYYNKFVKDTKNILVTLGRLVYNDFQDAANATNSVKPPPTLPVNYDQDKKWMLLNSPLKAGFVMQQTFVGQDGVMSAPVLTKEIVKAIHGINDSTNATLANVQNLQDGGGTENLTGPVLNLLTIWDIPVENLKILAEEHAQVYSEGYTTNTIKNAQLPLWQFDLLFSNEELSELILRIKSLSIEQGLSPDQLREAFKNAWMQVLKSHMGSVSNKEIEEMSLAEAEATVFGAVGKTELLQHKIRDIGDASIISDRDLTKWVNRVGSKEKILNKIRDNIPGYQHYSFINHEQRFYWIQQTDLP